MIAQKLKESRYLVILSTPKGDTRRSWNTRHPLRFRKPLQWTLKATQTGALLNSTEYDEELLRAGVRLTPGVWIRILPADAPEPAFSNISALERSWRGSLTRSDQRSNFRRFSVSLICATFLLLGPIVLWKVAPKLDIEEVLVPQQFARIIMSQKFSRPAEQSHSYATNTGGASAKMRALVSSEVSFPQARRAVFSPHAASAGPTFSSLTALAAMPVAAPTTGKDLEGLVGKGAGYRTGEVHHLEGQGTSKIEIQHALATVDEGLSRDEVGKVIYSHLSEVRACYESAIVRNPGAEGKLVLNFSVTPSGGARSVLVSRSSLNDSNLEHCIAQNLTSWRFPRPRGGTEVAVSYPFIFKMLGRI